MVADYLESLGAMLVQVARDEAAERARALAASRAAGRLLKLMKVV
jgi:hypothetical protein